MSDKKNKQIIKRNSFKPLEWVCKSIFLNVKIYDDFTIVESKLLFNKRQAAKKVSEGLPLTEEEKKILYFDEIGD